MKRFVLFSIVLLTIVSCSEDEEVPCANAVLPSINIATLSVVEDSLFEEDTFLVSRESEVNVMFSVSASDRDFDSLSWQIGSDPRTFTESTFDLWFDIYDVGVIDISLTLWRTRNQCFPEDSTVSVRKQIHLLSRKDNPYAFEGAFTGYNESDPDRVFDVTVVNFGPFPPPTDDTQYWLHVHNLTEGCGGDEILPTNRIPEIEMASYRYFYLNDIANTTNNCQEIRGYGRSDSAGNKLVIDYEYRITDTNETREDRFVGVRKSL